MPMEERDDMPVREGPTPKVEKIQLEDIDVSELRDVTIGDRETFFDNYEIHRVGLPEASCNKICLSADSKYLYAAGPRGSL